jgi:hypothetical protein
MSLALTGSGRTAGAETRSSKTIVATPSNPSNAAIIAVILANPSSGQTARGALSAA